MVRILLVLLTIAILYTGSLTYMVNGRPHHARLYRTTYGTVIQFDRPLPMSELQRMHAQMRRAMYRTVINHTR